MPMPNLPIALQSLFGCVNCYPYSQKKPLILMIIGFKDYFGIGKPIGKVKLSIYQQNNNELKNHPLGVHICHL
ncbi:protein of unknown function [Candidatus Nitrosacidococcus tergens]|uniref:Uncharacterized protein n=1 Tax=Candidatus Nitrosacidococcus tergens TaxID=553981 RepID=A0A7G1Q8Z4_9GAMM|nr:protein of unknown function [Candidatus Nitrosacidococcus tergens]